MLFNHIKQQKNRGNPRVLSWQPQPDCKFPPRHIRHGGPLSARKVQTRYAYFYQLRARTVPVQIWGTDSKIKNDHNGRCLFWLTIVNELRTTYYADIMNIAIEFEKLNKTTNDLYFDDN